MRRKNSNLSGAGSRGFTLIELLMSVALIAIMSSLSMNWIGSARAKTRDSKVQREFQEVRTALSLYYSKYGRYPNETPVSSNPYRDNFNDMAQELVQEGFLAALPVSPPGHEYHYYNYGGTTIGALLVTNLETYPPSTAYPNTCRPWPANSANWCTADANRSYCICNPY